MEIAVPKLLETVCQGLLTIGYPSASVKEFFEHLERINRSAMTVRWPKVRGALTLLAQLVQAKGQSKYRQKLPCTAEG